MSLFNLVFVKNSINIPAEAINAVIHNHDTAAILFVENCYTLLTGDPLIGERNNIPDSVVPHFSLATTNSIIRSVADTTSKAELILKAHNEYIKSLRGTLRN